MRNHLGIGLIFWSTLASAQQWATKCGGLGNERVVDVKAGPGDALFSIGEFGPGSSVEGQSLVSEGLSDVFVMKQSAAGVVQWIAEAGGAGLDLAGKVCPAPDGSVVVCGQFSGTADLFGATVTAQGGSTDLFVAKLTGSGSLQWVRTGGSAAYTDRASGVAVGADGRVLLTGEFRGEGVFDAGTFTSTIDPNTSLPGSDVFIASYTADGTAEWFVQGIAERDDQAADVTVDASGAAYAFGLYSGTISFGVPHPNTALNQMYLAKFSAAGQEQWFRRIGDAALQQPVDLQLGDSGGLFLCGNVEGPLTFHDNAPNTVTSTSTNACFILRCSPEGEFESGSAIGSVNAVQVGGMYQHGGTAGLYGSFVCAFTDLQAHYGATGIFIATGEEDLFLTEHDAETLALVEAQQFGGHEGKSAGGVTALSSGELVFCGAFSEMLIIPSDDDAWGDDFDLCPPFAEGSGSYCGDDNYTTYAGMESTGEADGFITRGYVDSREPYDPFTRTGTGCDRSALDLVIFSYDEGVTDNALVCDGDTLSWIHTVHLPYCPSCECPPERTVSWIHEDLWSTGQDYFDTTIVWNTGWYWRTHTSSNGCYDIADSIYLTVLPTPQGWVSIDGGPPLPGPATSISACEPIASLLAMDLLPGEVAQWYFNGAPVQGNPIPADQSGVYTLIVTSPNGCVGIHAITFTLLPNLSLPNITSADFDFIYNGVPLDVQDTIQSCDEVFVQGYMDATWYVDGVATPLGQPHIIFAETNDVGGGASYADQAIPWFVPPGTSGWYVLDMDLRMTIEGCSIDSLVFEAIDSVYIATGNSPQIAPLADQTICIGDTAVMVLDCQGCSTIQWSGPGSIITSPGLDTAWVTEFGSYSVIATNTEGILCGAVEYFEVFQALPPPLDLFPLSVCPGDSAILSTPFVAVQYEWSGPGGPIPIDNDTIQVSELGAYYLTTYTDQGCALFAGPAILTQHSTPSLTASPDAVLCAGQSTALVVTGGGVEQITWNPPLSGGSSSQSVSEGGTYACTVVSCADTFDLSIAVYASTVDATVPTGPFTICGEGSVVLDGPAGAYTYLWLPDNTATEDLVVATAGNYQLQLTDTLGCQDLSDTVNVAVQLFSEPLVVAGDTVCAGEDVVLLASGSGTIAWYGDAALTEVLGAGASLSMGAPSGTDTLYVTQTEDDCTGGATLVVLVVLPVPGPVTIAGDTVLCEGEELQLTASAFNAGGFLWSTPQGPSVGAEYGLPAIIPDNEGIYRCETTGGICGTSTGSVSVTVLLNSAVPVITGATLLCEGDPLTLTVTGVAADALTWSGPAGILAGVGSVYNAIATNATAGTYTVLADGGACADASASIVVVVESCGIIIPNVFTPNNDGDNDLFTIEGSGSTRFTLRIFNRWGQEVYMKEAAEIAWNGRDHGNDVLADGVYYYELIVNRRGNLETRTGYVQLARGR